MIGIAPRNPLYHPVKPGTSDKLKMPMIKRQRGKVEVLEPVSDAENRYCSRAVECWLCGRALCATAAVGCDRGLVGAGCRGRPCHSRLWR